MSELIDKYRKIVDSAIQVDFHNFHTRYFIDFSGSILTQRCRIRPTLIDCMAYHNFTRFKLVTQYLG